MCHYSCLPFDDDVIDCIISFLPDFESLGATIRTSKAFLRVFHAHENTILQEMCIHIIGPILPYALRVARFENANKDPDLEDGVVWFEVQDVGPETDQLGTIASGEVKYLLKHASDMRKFEDLFSLNYKNMASPSSLLTADESFRFQRAMYRIILFSRLFPLKVYKEDFAEDEVEDVRAFHEEFLQCFNTRELQELYAVCKSLSLLVFHVCHSNGIGDDTPPWVGHALIAAGPSTILKLYEIQDHKLVTLPLQGPWGKVNDVDIGDWLNPLNGYLHDPLCQILEAQQAKLDELTYPTVILDSYEDGPSRCDHCGSDFLKYHFWNKDNWSMMKYGYDDFGSLRYPERFLKGLLLENKTEWPFYASIFDVENFDYVGLMNGLFEVKLERFGKWEPEHWACSTCVATFISENLHHLLWKLHEEEWEKPGDPIRYNCLNGYSCKLQLSNPIHAKNNNHFFDPKRVTTPRVKGCSNIDADAFLGEWKYSEPRGDTDSDDE